VSGNGSRMNVAVGRADNVLTVTPSILYQFVQ